jgi:membrane protein required for colicin V production
VSWLDWTLLAVLLLSALLGLWRGLVYEVLSLGVWVAAFLLAQAYAARAGAWLPLDGFSEPLQLAMGFAAVFLVVAFTGGALAWLIKKLVESAGLRPVDRVLGSVFGLLRGLVILLGLAMHDAAENAAALARIAGGRAAVGHPAGHPAAAARGPGPASVVKIFCISR